MLYRSFIALQLSEASRYQLAELADHYQTLDKYNEISWPAFDNYHLTLAFLGDQAPDDLQRLAEQLDYTVQMNDNTAVTASELSYFPYHSRPSALAAMIHLDSNLERLKNQVEQALRSTWVSYEKRKFIPHVTLGRIRGRKSPRLAVPPSYLNLELSCPALNLYRSERRSDGAIYTPLYTMETTPLDQVDDAWG